MVVFEYQMLHTKFEGHQPVGSEVEDFEKFLPYMSMATTLFM